MKSWKRWALPALLIVALALGVVRALDKREQQQAAARAAAAPAAAALALSDSDLFVAAQIDLEQGVAFSGTLKALRSAAVKARIAGELQGLKVREGDRVRAGELLARIDPTESRARVSQTEQQALAAQAQLAIAQRQHDNNQALLAQGFISPTAAQGSASSLDAARANLQAARAAVEIARKSLSDTELRAPISGQVAARLAQDGERVAIDAKVVEIVDASALEIEAMLPAADALSVRTGQSASWQAEGVAQAAEARIVRIAPSAQTGSRMVAVYLSLPQTDGLRQGLFVEGWIATGRLHTVAVPLSALRHEKPRPYLQLLRDGRIVHLPVDPGATGRSGGETLVAVPGLAAGERVLRASAGAIAAGSAARVAAN